jgi:hypothetical protein
VKEKETAIASLTKQDHHLEARVATIEAAVPKLANLATGMDTDAWTGFLPRKLIEH